jgi:hypothetical protein
LALLAEPLAMEDIAEEERPLALEDIAEDCD